MGQETSHLIDPDTPPDTLSERSLRAVAQFIKDGGAKNIVVLTGAGISTAAGIPDFRSPKTGLYHNLSRFNLPHPEAVFEIDFFRSNPEPFYLLAKELYPGNFSPTVSHAFIALLARKGLLRMLFTQNIDCLERAAGVPADKIVEAHGSFATQRCVDCRAAYPDDEMREHVRRGEPPRCPAPGCGGLVKPDIVFFGEQLPEAFYAHISVPAAADLMLVMGTSLLVHPFAGLPRRARDGVPRVLFNLERVGDLGSRADDVLVLGDCDSGVRRLADELGWRGELEALWRATVGDEEAARQLSRTAREDRVRDELEQLAGDVEDKLGFSSSSSYASSAVAEGDGDSGANVRTQGQEHEQEKVQEREQEQERERERELEGGKHGSAAETRTPDGAKEGDEKGVGTADAPQRVDDGGASTTVPAAGEDTEKEKEEDKDKDAETQGGAKTTLSYEPIRPTKEKPITAEDGVKPEDKGGGDKPAL